MSLRTNRLHRNVVIGLCLGMGMYFIGFLSPFWRVVWFDMSNLNSSSSLNWTLDGLNSTSDGQNSTCDQRQEVVTGLWQKCSMSPFICTGLDEISDVQVHLSLSAILLVVSCSSFLPCAKKCGITVRNVDCTWDKVFPVGLFASLEGAYGCFVYATEAASFNKALEGAYGCFMYATEAGSFNKGPYVRLHASFYIILFASFLITYCSIFILHDRYTRRSSCVCATTPVRTDDVPPRRNVEFQVVVQFPDKEEDGIVQIPHLEDIGVEQLAKCRT